MELEYQAELLVNKIKHYLITTMGVTIDEASDEEFYRAFSLTLREEIMINWTATAHTFRQKRVRKLHYLCMEYMPGRLLGNNITNINATDLIQLVMKRMERNFEKELRIERDPGLGNGGLGRLAACLLDSLATQDYPAMGYGLRYQYGIFEQELWEGAQVERPENWLLHENPWEFRRDDHSVSVYFCGEPIPSEDKICNIAGCEEVRALAYDIPIIGYKESPDFNVLTLRLWTTKESPRNFQLQRYNAGRVDQAAENTTLTDVLYPNDDNEVGKRIRLKQEFLLASASVQDIVSTHMRLFGDISSLADLVRIQINDTHPALAVVELLRLLIKQHQLRFEEALEIVQTCCSYTNHTILRESLEEWNEGRLRTLLPQQYQLIERLNQELVSTVRAKFPQDEERVRRLSIIEGGQIRMAHLLIYTCHSVNGVARLHSEILKEFIFKDFYELYPSKFVNVTNGVTQRRWLLHANPRLAEFITKRIGRGWMTDLAQLRQLAPFASDSASQLEFLEIKKQNKRRLIEFLNEHNPLRDVCGFPIASSINFNEEALFAVQIKRFHEYKRQLMNALHLLMVYHELLDNPESRKVSRVALFAGKAAPGYAMAKNIIMLVACLARKIDESPLVNQKLRIIFVENYNVSRAEMIIPAADLSEQISTAGMEASGTGNMKLALNGALTICTEDGSSIEMHEAVTDQWWPFSFGRSARQNFEMRENGNYAPLSIYLQNDAIRRAVNALQDGSLTHHPEEGAALSAIYRSLVEGSSPDRFLVLSDLMDYYETQKKVEELYQSPQKWAEFALHNMAAMGSFSSDQSVHNYSKLIWGLEKIPVDRRELEKVRAEYSEHDKCRILPKTS